jgi:hypothetical protein
VPKYGTVKYGSAPYGVSVPGTALLPSYTCTLALGGTGLTMIVGDPLRGIVGVNTVGGGPFMDASPVDLAARLQGFTSTRGRGDAWSGITPGTVSVTLDDDDGAFDPENASSPYYPNVKLTRRLAVTATYGGVTYGLGCGYVDSYQAQPLTLGADVLVTATDLFKRLQNRHFSASFPAQTVGQRVHALLNLLQWPAASRAIDPGRLTVPAQTFTNGTPLSHLDDVLKAEQGLFWIDGSGVATYRDRAYRQAKASRGTFGIGGLPIKDIHPDFSDTNLWTQVVVQRSGGVMQVANDAAGQADNDVRTYTLPASAANLLPDDIEASRLASYILTQAATPNQRIKAIDLDPEAEPSGALWPHVLGAEIGDRITVTHSRPGTSGIIAADYFIEQITHSWKAAEGNHACTWQLSKAPPGAWLIVGDPTRGIVGQNVVGY